MFKVIERLLGDKIATEKISLTGSERFRGKITGSCPENLREECAKACPVGAFQVTADAQGYAVDYKKCLFCGKCVEKAMGSLQHSSDEALPVITEDAAEVTAEVIKQKLGRSLHVRHLDAGSCNACDFEMGAMSNPIYDLHRYGVHVDASPRHADLLMVTGVDRAVRMRSTSWLPSRFIRE